MHEHLLTFKHRLNFYQGQVSVLLRFLDLYDQFLLGLLLCPLLGLLLGLLLHGFGDTTWCYIGIGEMS